jgi:hypothetical protein
MILLHLAVTGLDVVDDAIKIGLSGAIGAVASYLMLRRSQRHDFNRDLFDRRQAIIDRASDDFERIHTSVRDALLNYAEYRRLVEAGLNQGNSKPKSTVQEVANCIGEASRTIQPVEAKLLLINEVNARKLMAEYRLMLPKVRAIVASLLTSDHAPVEAADSLRQALYNKRNAIYADLAKIYGSPDRAQPVPPEEAT